MLYQHYAKNEYSVMVRAVCNSRKYSAYDTMMIIMNEIDEMRAHSKYNAKARAALLTITRESERMRK